MKQKRKVKSLISPKSESSVWLATLLFLLGWILVFWAVALFTSSVWVASAEDDWYNLEYENWIEDKVEVLLNLKFAHSGGNLTVNKMFLSWNTFYMEWNAWITVDGTVASIANNKYINYLWWENRWGGFMNVASDNITVIWWSNDQVYQGNDNAALLGWIGNLISNWNNSVAPTMLWWQTNTIGTNQIGNAIVWWSNNSISNSGQYDFIIWWNNNQIKGDNVIVWWANVNVDERSNLFAFNGEDTTFTPQSLNAFYLNLKWYRCYLSLPTASLKSEMNCSRE